LKLEKSQALASLELVPGAHFLQRDRWAGSNLVENEGDFGESERTHVRCYRIAVAYSHFMRPFFQVLFLIWLATLGPGCASGPRGDSSSNSHPDEKTVAGQCRKLKTGMTGNEVVSLIGSPDRVTPSVSARGQMAQWEYSTTTLIQNIEGADQAKGHAFSAALAGDPDEVVYMIFENDTLTRIHVE
jgi:hypothetical protein